MIYCDDYFDDQKEISLNLLVKSFSFHENLIQVYYKHIYLTSSILYHSWVKPTPAPCKKMAKYVGKYKHCYKGDVHIL